MNGPYEWKCLRSDDPPSQLILEETEKEVAERFSVTCFSKSWNNIGYPEDVRIIKAGRSLTKFEIIEDESGF